MPELPEVETVVRTLRPLVAGRTFVAVELLRNDIHTPPTANLVTLLTNQQVTDISRRGKKILLNLSSGQTLCIHLGMTGRLTVESPNLPIPKHTHFLATLNSKPPTQLRFRDPRRFGGLTFLSNPADAHIDLGPEPLTLRPAQLAKILSRTRRPIKSALLDQSLIAGLGNIYADEALFLSQIHPLTPANTLSPAQISKLNRAIKHILKKAIHHKGSTLRDYVDATGQPGSFHKLHHVYARQSKPCTRCGQPITRLVISGRSAHFCPKCQSP
jgi:formamidopyrimidine-DNA glycosylase